MDLNSAPHHRDQPRFDEEKLIRFLRQFQLVAELFHEANHAPAEASSPMKKRRSRPAPLLSVRWWSERTGYPVSTLYAAIKKRHLKARGAKGSTYRVELEDFEAWRDGPASPDFKPAPRAAHPPSKSDSPPPAFRHVRWSELPDETPREADGS